MIPLKRSVEEKKVKSRFFYSNDRFILSPFLYVLLLYSFSRIKIDRKTATITSHHHQRELSLVFERDVVFEIVVVSFERFRVRENIETRGNVIIPLKTGLRAHTLNIKNIIRNNARLLLTARFDDQIEKKTERSTTRTKILRMKSLTKVDSRAIFPARTMMRKMVQRTTPPCDRTATAP